MKNVLKRLLRWAFASELTEMRLIIKESKKDAERIKSILGNMDVSVDFHHHSPSWAVISIQGVKSDYIKFVDLGQSEIMEINRFLSMFDRAKVDCSPMERIHFTRNKFWKI